MSKIVRSASTLLIASIAVCSAARGDVRLPAVFGSSMVLQQGMPVPLWGWAAVGEQVTVSFAGQTHEAVADDAGRWRVTLKPLDATATGRTLQVSGLNTIELEDVVVGEVWLCSGQSNMEWSVSQALNGAAEVSAANHAGIRLFNVPGHTTASTPQAQGKGTWQVCQPVTVRGFSAVGYYFGRQLHPTLQVPVGLIGVNWGGTRIEPWIPLAGFESVPELATLANQVREDRRRAQSSVVRVEAKTPSAICNSMVQPLAPFAVRGAIWYQGESNGDEGELYYHKMTALINGWRKLFNPALAFYWVQLASFREATDDPAGGDGWARLREAQRRSLSIPRTGMAVIIDIGDAADVHPRNKQDVGYRLAQWAVHQTYGHKNVVPSGPLYNGHTIEGDRIRVTFDHVGSGLMVGEKTGLEAPVEVASGTLRRFAIAGEDQQWHWAEATIEGRSVVVRSAGVSKPVAVRYAYSMNPAGANLYNKDGLPASPFRTDQW